MHPECPDSDPSDQSVAANVLLCQEPEEEEDQEEDEGDGNEDDDETTKTRTATRSERAWFQQIIGIQFGTERSTNEVSSSVRDWILVGR